MARSLEPLVVGKVIGDVVDMFSPAAEFTVKYGSKQVTNGCEIKPSSAADKPKFQILGPRVPSNHYTLVCRILHFLIYIMELYIYYVPKILYSGLFFVTVIWYKVMVDPDAPSPSEPTLREWLHWYVY